MGYGLVRVGGGKWLKEWEKFLVWGGDCNTLSLIPGNNYEDY
jgi:hypothetical protein